MTGIIDSLKNEGVLVIYHDYRAGHVSDLSGNSNDGVMTNTEWNNKGIRFSSTNSVITVADSAELQLTEGTLIAFGDFDSQVSNEDIIWKGDGGGDNYRFYLTSTRTHLHDGSTDSFTTIDTKGKKYIAYNFADGEIPELFLDGISAGVGSQAVAISKDDAPLLIGNYNTPRLLSILKAAIIINRKLTATEHAQLYAELENIKFPTKTKGQAKVNTLPNLSDTGAQLLADGNMEAAGVTDWVVLNDAVLTKETTNPKEGKQVLRVAYGGTNFPRTRQTILTTGKIYRITGWARGAGIVYPYITTGGAHEWDGTTSTSWQYFDIVVTADSTTFNLFSFATAAGYAEFDDVTVNEITLVGAWDMKPVNNTVVDSTSSGNNATIYGATYQKTLLGDALYFDSNKYITVASSTDYDVTTDGTMSFWMKPDNITGNRTVVERGAGLGKVSINIRIDDGVMDAGISTPTKGASHSDEGSFSIGNWYYIVMTVDTTANKTYLYSNGELINTEDLTNVSFSPSTDAMEIGRDSRGSGDFIGLISGFNIFTDAKSDAWVAKEYLRGAEAIQYKTDYGVNESVANVTSGELENSGWTVESGTWKVSTDYIDGPLGDEELTDGNMEATGVTDWISERSGTLSKATGTRTGGTGTQVLRITYGGTSNGAAGQDIITAGKSYRATGWARSDGIRLPRVLINEGATVIWTGTTSTDWQYFDIVFEGAGVNMWLAMGGGAATNYVEFDDVTVKPVINNVKVFECVSAGVLYIPIEQFMTSTEAAYGTWEFWMNRSATGNPLVMFMADVIGEKSATGQDGYSAFWNNSASTFACAKSVNGSTANKIITAATVPISTSEHYKITRTSAGVLTIYRNDAPVVPTTGTNPFTDAAVTTSKYIVLDFDAGDKIAIADVKGDHSITKSLGVK